jgi:Uma2 family endonuclease
MTIIDPPIHQPRAEAEGAQRFLFRDVDWAFYEDVGEKLADRRAFVTYYKGRLEVVTVSLLHERIVGLLTHLVRMLAEETDTPIGGAGMATLQRVDLDEGAEPDSSFYTAHEGQMRGKEKIDLTVDPPPDLAIEVEVTRRLGQRKSIYQDFGVPEVWVYGAGGLTILVRESGRYISADRSPTFPLLSPQELSGFVSTGLVQDETAWAKAFRRRVREAMGTPPPTT